MALTTKNLIFPEAGGPGLHDSSKMPSGLFLSHPQHMDCVLVIAKWLLKFSAVVPHFRQYVEEDQNPRGTCWEVSRVSVQHLIIFLAKAVFHSYSRC